VNEAINLDRGAIMTDKPLTEVQALVQSALGEDLKIFIGKRRAQEVSWRRISEEIHLRSNGRVSVSYESIRCWFPELRDVDPRLNRMTIHRAERKLLNKNPREV
jgi:hypothetical protein